VYSAKPIKEEKDHSWEEILAKFLMVGFFWILSLQKLSLAGEVGDSDLK